MEVFSAFSFGRLIKTFLPGFLSFIALCLFFDFVLQHPDGNRSVLLDWVNRSTSSALVISFVSIPISTILGVMSNTLVFSLLLNSFIRDPFVIENPEIAHINERLKEKWASASAAEIDIAIAKECGWRTLLVDEVSPEKSSFWRNAIGTIWSSN